MSIDYILYRQGNLADSGEIEGQRLVPVVRSIKQSKKGLVYEVLEQEILVDCNKGSFMGLKITDNSMLGLCIREGNIVLVKRQKEIESGNLAVVIVDDHEAFLRRVHMDKSGNILLEATNPDYPPKLISQTNKQSLTIIGKAVEVIRKLN